jgi:hypothetical protein
MSGSIQETIRLTHQEVQKASSDWGFNCGPGAICAALNITPSELRPHLGDFEAKRYTNPRLMTATLGRLGVAWRQVYRSEDPNGVLPILNLALVRVQWGGPWTNPGVPMMARYRQTHWIAVRNKSTEVFDVNAVHLNRWLPRKVWSDQLVPWLCREVVPQWDGRHWFTHALEVSR